MSHTTSVYLSPFFSVYVFLSLFVVIVVMEYSILLYSFYFKSSYCATFFVNRFCISEIVMCLLKCNNAMPINVNTLLCENETVAESKTSPISQHKLSLAN